MSCSRDGADFTEEDRPVNSEKGEILKSACRATFPTQGKQKSISQKFRDGME
jgi:hypothetical protein